MTKHRNVGFDDSLSLHDWPAEAIADLVERGTLTDWRNLAAALDEEPWGRVADVITALAESGHTIGNLLHEIVERRRRHINEMARRRYAELIAETRRATGLSMREFAARVGTSASRLSDYENAKVSPTGEVIGRIEEIAGRIRSSGRGAP